MEFKRKNRLVEWGKDLLILLLAVSAVYLLGRTQLYDSGGGQSWLSGVLSLLPGGRNEPSAQPAGGWGQGGVMRPARIALRSDVSRYGVQYDSEKVADLFAQLINPLSDALAGAEAPTAVGQRVWREALTAARPSVYLDFLGPIPLADLDAWLSGGRSANPNLTGTARRMLLAQTGDGDVVLYYINENDGLYYACKTSPSLWDRLAALVDGVPNNAVFAFEDSARYGALAPYTLLCQEAPLPRQYAVTNPILLLSPLPNPVSLDGSPELDEFVRGLSFHPQSYTAYAVTDGVSLQEGGDRLTITGDGVVTFRAAGEENARYPVASAEEPTLWEMVDGAWAFVEKNVGALCGDAWLYLSSLEELPEGGAEVCFSYQLDGADVLVGSEGYAARIVVRGGAITEFTLQLRSYTATGETTLVLQELRAAAAMEALDAEGSELLLCYQDRGGSPIAAGWIAR